jgi:hypothetical protein
MGKNDTFFLRFGGRMPLLLPFFYTIDTFIHHSFIHKHSLRPIFISISSQLSAQWAEPQWGAEPGFELGPALQQASALPTEPRCTLLSHNARLTDTWQQNSEISLSYRSLIFNICLKLLFYRYHVTDGISLNNVKKMKKGKNICLSLKVPLYK